MLVCVFLFPFARETAGAARIRLSLRPLLFRGWRSTQSSDASRREIENLRLQRERLLRGVIGARRHPVRDPVGPTGVSNAVVSSRVTRAEPAERSFAIDLCKPPAPQPPVPAVAGEASHLWRDRHPGDPPLERNPASLALPIQQEKYSIGGVFTQPGPISGMSHPGTSKSITSADQSTTSEKPRGMLCWRHFVSVAFEPSSRTHLRTSNHLGSPVIDKGGQP